MTVSGWLLLACAAAYATKLCGYLIPHRWLQHQRMVHVSGVLTIGLLSALTAMNTFAGATGVVLDARLASLVAAALALWLRASFLLVVVVGAGAAALLRLAGIG